MDEPGGLRCRSEALPNCHTVTPADPTEFKGFLGYTGGGLSSFTNAKPVRGGDDLSLRSRLELDVSGISVYF